MTLRIEDVTRQREITIYDTALPQGWADLVWERLSRNPSGHVVWCYDEPFRMFGIPRAIDNEGDLIVGALAGAVR